MKDKKENHATKHILYWDGHLDADGLKDIMRMKDTADIFIF
jgi:hypothetical protein